jgi:hypothetical protein
MKYLVIAIMALVLVGCGEGGTKTTTTSIGTQIVNHSGTQNINSNNVYEVNSTIGVINENNITLDFNSTNL